MFSRSLACLLVLLPLAVVHAQTATGRVVTQATGTPLPYTTVRLDGQPVGTRTDETGRFRLPVAGAAPDARLIISHLGYESHTLPLNQLGPTVALEELSYQIGEVLVTYESLRKRLLRKWKVDDGSVVAVADNIIAEAQEKDSLKAQKLLQSTSSIRYFLKQARVVFLDNGTVKTKFWLFGSHGKWQLDEAQRTLHIVGSTGGTDEMTVVELTANRLVVHSAKPNRQNEVYSPAD